MTYKERLEAKKKELAGVYQQLLQQKAAVEQKLILTKGGYAVLEDLLKEMEDRKKGKVKGEKGEVSQPEAGEKGKVKTKTINKKKGVK